MSMYDEVLYQGNRYQTKDFECLLEEYRITPAGRLVKDLWHMEDVPKSEQRYPDAKPGSLLSIAGIIRRVIDQHDVDTKYHGMLHFHGDDGSFTAKFTDGQLVEILRDG